MVTGPQNTYVYLKQRKEENDTIFTQDHSQINSLEQGRKISTNFTCHSWSQITGMILICTDNGEMLLCANNGEYKSFILDAPEGKPINSVYSYSNGFVVCTDNYFNVFQTDDGDERALLTPVGDPIPLLMKDSQGGNQMGNTPCSITSITSNEDEDKVYAITSHGQLIQAPLVLGTSGLNDNEEVRFDHVLAPFHRAEITGLDVCIRKELIATCSRDKTVNIWNYAQKTHEICTTFTEECLTLAFHPSGLHLVIATQDKIQMCNVLSKEITPFKTMMIKGCNEIRFSNGGHLFACVAQEKTIHVFNFFTGDCGERMQFQGHMARIMSIDWYGNDMGFTTCGQDGNIYFYDLYTNGPDVGDRNRTKDKTVRDVKFSSVVNLPGHPYEFLAVGSEKTIYTEMEPLKVVPRPTSDVPHPKPELPELKHHISQIVIHHSGKILFAGVGEQSEINYPGAIQVWKLPFEKAAEIQAHASPITRMRITHTNTHLFSVGCDGMLAIFDVKDRDPKRDPESVMGQLKFSQEILSDKTEVEALEADMENLNQKSINQKEADMEVDIQLNVKSQQSTIAEKKNQLVSQRQQAENKK